MSTKRDPIIRQLKRLSYIEPDSNFTTKLRGLILDKSLPVEPQIQVTSGPLIRWPVFAIAGSGIFVLLALFAITQFSQPATVRASSLDTTTLIQEFDELTLNIQLKEINYQDDVSGVISEAVKEIANTQTSHLNTSLIDAEQNILTIDDVTNSEIDSLLEKIIK